MHLLRTNRACIELSQNRVCVCVRSCSFTEVDEVDVGCNARNNKFMKISDRIRSI